MPDENKKPYVVITRVHTLAKYEIEATDAEHALRQFNTNHDSVKETFRSIQDSEIIAIYDKDLIL